MAFAVGESIGPYKITQYIGQGGMATIYRAHQTTLDRDVALKVIHPALKEDHSFILRLKREASIVAKLNHPNIVPVYDYGESEGVQYIVMRFIEGKTLKDVLHAQKLATNQIMDIIRPVGDAMTYAHTHGVLHRDVKPSNILVDNEGHVYLADFGLARLAQSGESTLSQDMIIGSPQYISPEQARGESADARSDIYSLGVVMYEMFVGKVPFIGETPYATMLQHINEPLPSPRSINSDISPAVEQVLEKALAKTRENRFQSVREMMRALENALRGPRDEDVMATPIPVAASDTSDSNRGGEVVESQDGSRKRSPLLLLGIGVLALCLLLACVLGISAFVMETPLTPLVSFLQPRRPTIPIGSFPRLLTPTPTQAAGVVPTTVAGVSTNVPATLPVSTANTPVRPAAAKGIIAYSVFTNDSPEGHTIWIANADGSNARQLLETAMWPSISPDGKSIAFYRLKDTGIWIANIDGGAPRKIIAISDTCCISWAPDGKRIAYFRGSLRQKSGGSIFTANIDGTNITEIVAGFNPAWNPDGNQIAYGGCEANTTQCGIFVMDLRTKAARLITRDNGANPQWSPRGDRIIYQADDGKSNINIFLVSADGAIHRQITTLLGNNGQPDWSRDGNFIFFRSDQNHTSWGIFVIPIEGGVARMIVARAAPDADLWGRESLSAGP